MSKLLRTLHGQFYIDWSHPMAKGLVGVWLFGIPVNLAALEDGIFNTNSAPNRLHGNVTITAQGNLNITSARQCLEVGNRSYHNGDMSIVSRITPSISQSDSTPTICSADSSTDNKREWQFRLDSTDHLQFIPFVNNSNGSIIGSTALNRMQTYTVGCSHSSVETSNNCKVYLDGELDGIGTKTGSLDSEGANVGIGARLLRSVVATGSDIVDEFIGEFEFTYLYNRSLSDDDFKLLYGKPDQFIKIARTVANDAVYAALFQPSSINTYTHNATGGVASGGSAVTSTSKAYQANGGIATGGIAAAAKISVGINTYTYIGAGGTVSGGLANVIQIKHYLTTGGAAFNGAAITTKISAGISTHSHIASGGINAGGSAKIIQLKNHLSSGGTATSGTAAISKISADTNTYTHIASGGIFTSGSAQIISIKDYLMSGGVTTGGQAVTWSNTAIVINLELVEINWDNEQQSIELINDNREMVFK